MKYLFLFLWLLLPFLAEAQSFEEYKRMEQERRQQHRLQDSLGKLDLQADYDAYIKAEARAYAGFVKDVERIWGKKDVKLSTNKDWVEYSDDRTRRSVVDFEKGEAKVEMMLTDTSSLRKIVADELKNLLNSQGSSKDYATPYETPDNLSEKPILQGLVTDGQGETLTTQNIPSKVEEIIEENVREETVVCDGQSQIKVVVTLPLAPDYIQKRAAEYAGDVSVYASKYKMEEALVYAVMHTESYFNPKAKSYVPAYGLMQIVPKYAGREAYKFLYGEDKLLSANYLYQPKNNIEIGVAYLYLMQTRYFAEVENADCRILCSIAAYNTGAGNVSKAFVGSTNLKKAIPQINRYSYDELYAFLREHLSTQEAREYVRKVTEQRGYYRQWTLK